MRRRGGSVLFAAILVTVACSADDQLDHTFEVRDENGVSVAINSAVPQFAGELFRYEKVVEILPDPAIKESFLYEPTFVALDDSGLVYVGERGNRRVSVWNLEGEYLRSIGKPGEGPGEFPAGPLFGIDVRDGVVSVPLVSTGRTIRFLTDGTYLDTLSTTVVPRPMSIYEGPRGERVVIDQLDTAPYTFSARVTVVAADQVKASFQTRSVRIAGYSGAAQAVFIPPDEVLLTTGEEPLIRWYGLDGAVRREVRFEMMPQPVTVEDRERVEAYVDQRIAQAPESPDDPGGESGSKEAWRRRRNNLRFAEAQGFWAGVLVSDDGWVWLMKSRPEKLDYLTNETYEARVVSPEGRYVGNTALPPGFVPSGLSGEYLMLLVNEPNTGERVPTVFRVLPAVPDLSYPGS